MCGKISHDLWNPETGGLVRKEAPSPRFLFSWRLRSSPLVWVIESTGYHEEVIAISHVVYPYGRGPWSKAAD